MSESNSHTGNRNGNETSFPAPYYNSDYRYNCRALSNLGNGTSTGPPDSELEPELECRRMWVTWYTHDQQLIICNVSKHAERRLDWQGILLRGWYPRLGILHSLRASEEWKNTLSSKSRYDTTTRFTRLAILRSCEMATSLCDTSNMQHVVIIWVKDLNM